MSKWPNGKKGEKQMKIRNGFVSNSSSSSFMLIGVKACDISLSLDEALDLGFETANDGELVGVHFYVSEYETESFTLAQIQTAAQAVRDKLGKEPEVFVGMEYS